jgi:Xaa-Pro aminopeptidase
MSQSTAVDIPKEPAFSPVEYGDRLARVRAAMDRDRLDLLLLHGLPDICYLTGFQTPLSDWYHCLIVPRHGAVALQVCDPELAVMNTEVETILPVLWERMDEAADDLAALLREHHVESGRIGVERRRPGLNPFTEDRLRSALPRADFRDASDLVPRLRAVKSPAEIACLRQAARFSTRGMEAAVAALAAGVTENAVCGAAMNAMMEAGSEFFCIDPIVRAGRRSGVTHATGKRASIQRGDPVLMELGGVYQRYCAPLLRTAVVGEPSVRLRRLADASLRTVDLVLDNLRPGRTMDEIARAAAKGYADVDPAVRMRGYHGYSVGIGFPPVWVERSVEIVEGSSDVLEPGMVFHVHRSLRVPGLMGVGFSETVAITTTGCELFTSHRRELVIV